MAHIWRHSVSPLEGGGCSGPPHLIFPAKTVQDEERWKIFGKTASGRYMVVVFTIRRKLFRTVTAYEMNPVERRKYDRQIEKLF